MAHLKVQVYNDAGELVGDFKVSEKMSDLISIGGWKISREEEEIPKVEKNPLNRQRILYIKCRNCPAREIMEDQFRTFGTVKFTQIFEERGFVHIYAIFDDFQDAKDAFYAFDSGRVSLCFCAATIELLPKNIPIPFKKSVSDNFKWHGFIMNKELGKVVGREWNSFTEALTKEDKIVCDIIDIQYI